MKKQLSHIVLFAAAAILTVACNDPSGWSEPLPPGTLVVESPSPDLSASARVIAQEKPGSYALEIRDGRTQELLARRAMHAAVGYHAHLITLDWSPEGNQVTATIDRDFGDNMTVFELAR